MTPECRTEVDDKTSINMKMAATVLVVVCGAVISLTNANNKLQNMEKDNQRREESVRKELGRLHEQLEYIMDTRWRSLDDLLYIRDLCELNGLQMPPKHKGLMYE